MEQACYSRDCITLFGLRQDKSQTEFTIIRIKDAKLSAVVHTVVNDWVGYCLIHLLRDVQTSGVNKWIPVTRNTQLSTGHFESSFM